MGGMRRGREAARCGHRMVRDINKPNFNKPVTGLAIQLDPATLAARAQTGF